MVARDGWMLGQGRDERNQPTRADVRPMPVHSGVGAAEPRRATAMRTIRPAIASIALIIFAMGLVACAGGSSAPELAPVGDELGSGDFAAASAAPAAPMDDQGEGSGQEGDGVGAPVDDASIIRTGSIDLEVDDVATSLHAARDGIRAMGGYIGAST